MMVYEHKSLHLRVEGNNKTFEKLVLNTVKNIVKNLNNKYPKHTWDGWSRGGPRHDKWESNISYTIPRKFLLFKWNKKMSIVWLTWEQYDGVKTIHVFNRKYLEIARFIVNIIERLKVNTESLSIEKHFY